MSELLPTIEEVKDLFARNKVKKLSKALASVLAANKDNIEEFYNWLVELIKQDSSNFFKSSYYRIRDEASKIISAIALEEMDKYLLENYALSEAEKIITSFRGTYKRPKATFKGFLFLTKFRFLAHGFLQEKGSSSVPSRPHGGLIGAAVSIAIEYRRQAARNAIKKALTTALGDKFNEAALDIFPYNFPILDAYNVKKSKKSVVYTLTLRYQTKRGKEKEETLKLEVIPKKEKLENPNDFNTRKTQILDKIEETLLKAQTS